MTEAIPPRPNEKDSPEEKVKKQSWGKLFMALLDISTKTGTPILGSDFDTTMGGRVIIVSGHLIDEYQNPTLIMVEVFKRGVSVQRAIASASWQEARPQVILSENLSTLPKQDTLNEASMIEGLANAILHSDTSAFLKQRN